ncbi:MAG: PH domain-containing protein [Actinomycetes bacterium]
MAAAESTVWSGSSSQILNLKNFAFWGFIAFIGILVAIDGTAYEIAVVVILVSSIAIAWNYFVIKMRVFEVTTQRLKMHSGVLSRETSELEFYRVTDTQFEQPFFLRIFGLANLLLISSDKTSPVIMIEAIPNAGRLREQIREIIEQRRDLKHVRLSELE